MRSSHTVLSTLALSGGLALALAGPAHAAVPAGSCESSTTFAVSAAPGVDAATVASLTEALEARGLTAGPAGSADLTASVAPASEIAEAGSPSVMAVAIGEGDLDPASVLEGTDWVGITTDAKGAANQLLDHACGPLQTPAPADEEAPAPAPAPAAGEAGEAAPAQDATPPPEAAPQEPAPAQESAPAPEATPAPEAAPAPEVAPAQEAAPDATDEPAQAAPSSEPATPSAEPKVGAAETTASTAAAPARQQPATTAAGEGRADAAGETVSASAATSASAASGGSASAASGATGSADQDCGDFDSHAEAQDFFEDHGGPQSDRHRLDADDDGLACETSGGETGGAATVAAVGATADSADTDATTSAVATAGATGASDKDCADFASQTEAQDFFTGRGGPASDRHRLDADDDGQACEDELGGDNASRVQARTISAGTPEASGISPVGLAGGALLVGAGAALGLRARRG